MEFKNKIKNKKIERRGPNSKPKYEVF